MDSRDSNSATVTISCRGRDAVRAMVERTQAFAIDRALDVNCAARLSIIVEELVYNLVDHGEIAEEGLVELVLTHEGGAIDIELSDSGVTFDPRTRESAAVTPERGGGAGIDLVRAWAEIVDYASDGGRNRLLLRMKLS